MAAAGATVDAGVEAGAARYAQNFHTIAAYTPTLENNRALDSYVCSPASSQSDDEDGEDDGCWTGRQQVAALPISVQSRS